LKAMTSKDVDVSLTFIAVLLYSNYAIQGRLVLR
jgi:hypothetical protein